MKLTLRLSLLLACVSAGAAQVPLEIQTYLKQPGFTWKCEPGPRFHFCWESVLAQDANMAAARRSGDPARAKILDLAGARGYDPVIYVFFLQSPERMEKLIGYRGEGRSRPRQHAIFFVPTPIRPDLTHELSHEILTNAWGVAEHWIEEGMATHVAQGDNANTMCRLMMVRGSLLPLEKLVHAGWDPSIYSPDDTYPELAGFIEYLLQHYGIASVRRIWQRGSKAIPAILGKPLRTLEDEWHSKLRARIGEIPHR